MIREDSDPLPAQRQLILGLLLAIAAASWVWLLWQGTHMGMTRASLTMGMAAPFFLLMWVVMMVAMMFPAAAPMIMMFHRIQCARRQNEITFIPTWIFVAGYLAVWTLAGVLAFAIALSAEAAAERLALSSDTAARAGAALLISAGLYQLTPWKNVCLTHCRTPTTFIVTSWREGLRGAFRMGATHGAFCLGCCWLLFLILFPLGIMNIAAMVLITLVVFAEKTMPWGSWIARLAAAILIAYGVAVWIKPALLPTFIGGSAMPMQMHDKHPEPMR